MRFADCRGSRICNNENCPYKKEYCVISKLQFNKDNACRPCGEHAYCVYCPARCYIQIKQNKLNIFHCGLHTCPVRSQSSEIPVETVKEMFKKSQFKTFRSSVFLCLLCKVNKLEQDRCASQSAC